MSLHSGHMASVVLDGSAREMVTHEKRDHALDRVMAQKPPVQEVHLVEEKVQRNGFAGVMTPQTDS